MRNCFSSSDLLSLLLDLTPHGSDMPICKFAELLNISSYELHDLLRSRKVINKKLKVQLIRLVDLLELLGDSILDRLNWLGKINKGFNKRRPIDMLKTEKGYKELVFMVEQIQSNGSC